MQNNDNVLKVYGNNNRFYIIKPYKHNVKPCITYYMKQMVFYYMNPSIICYKKQIIIYYVNPRITNSKIST